MTRYTTHENIHQVFHGLRGKGWDTTTVQQDVAEQRTKVHTPSTVFIHERAPCIVPQDSFSWKVIAHTQLLGRYLTTIVLVESDEPCQRPFKNETG